MSDEILQHLLENLDKLQTTTLGMQRIRNNLSLDVPDIVIWCRERILCASDIICKGKNWYIYSGIAVITVNTSSYTIITAHKNKL